MPLQVKGLRRKGQLPHFILGEMRPGSDALEAGGVGQRTAGCRTAPDGAENSFKGAYCSL